MGNIPHTGSIHILDDDFLLTVFCLYRPFLLGEDADARLVGGVAGWVHRRWLYKLTHVSQILRNLILGSATYLGVSLVCTNGTPIADMQAYSSITVSKITTSSPQQTERERPRSDPCSEAARSRPSCLP